MPKLKRLTMITLAMALASAVAPSSAQMLNAHQGVFGTTQWPAVLPNEKPSYAGSLQRGSNFVYTPRAHIVDWNIPREGYAAHVLDPEPDRADIVPHEYAAVIPNEPEPPRVTDFTRIIPYDPGTATLMRPTPVVRYW